MSDLRPDDDPELIVSLPEGSLEDLFAGLEASLKPTPDSTIAPEPVAELVQAPSPEPPQEEAPAVAEAAGSDQVERRGAIRKEPHEFKSELRLAVAGFPMRLVNLL